MTTDYIKHADQPKEPEALISAMAADMASALNHASYVMKIANESLEMQDPKDMFSALQECRGAAAEAAEVLSRRLLYVYER